MRATELHYDSLAGTRTAAAQFQGHVLAPSLPRAGEIATTRIPSRWRTVASFLISDAVGLAMAWVTIAAVDLTLPGTRILSAASFLPVLGLLEISYALVHVSTGAMLHPADEMRRISRVTTLVFAAFSIPLLPFAATQSIPLLATAWLATIVFVTMNRICLRMVCARLAWWGYPIVVVGRGQAGTAIIKTLLRWPELGLKPVVLLDDTRECAEVEGVPVHADLKYAPVMAQRYSIPYLIVALPPDTPHRQLQKLISRYSKFFERVLVIPTAVESQPLWTTASFFNGIPGYDIQHNARKRLMRLAKLTSDYVLASIAFLIVSPLFLTIVVLIKLDSPGPVFFRQLRIGQGGRVFEVLKFRSMYTDASSRLQDILSRDEALRKEYQTFRKLRHDPRVTRIGALLRRYSLDELPQLWNVLRGEMSLVGPRAYLFEELEIMGDMEPIILQNPPGITGLWQVSGRNHLSFEERVNLDVHYVHNWNFWLDAYILARSVPVVLRGEGAY